MTATLHIAGRLPGQNEMISSAKGFGGRGLGYSLLKKQWTKTVSDAAKSQRIPSFLRARLSFTWHEPKPSKFIKARDPDNIIGGQKMVLDGLVMAKVLPNDTHAYVAGLNHGFSIGRGPAGVTICIEEVET